MKKALVGALSNGKQEIIENMLAKNISISQIAELTGVSIEKITEISKNLK